MPNKSFVVVVEFHDKKLKPRVFGPFGTERMAKNWLSTWPYHADAPFKSPAEFARATVAPIEPKASKAD